MQVTKELAERVYAHASKGQLTVTLGGDHSLAMGTVSGTFRAYPHAGLVWVDAHAVCRLFRRHFSFTKAYTTIHCHRTSTRPSPPQVGTSTAVLSRFSSVSTVRKAFPSSAGSTPFSYPSGLSTSACEILTRERGRSSRTSVRVVRRAACFAS
jgi:hypothetical protein